MPQRPRSHQLQELSQRAFEAALPPAWVHRRHDPDYALDYTVSIFCDERATGLNFHVQLRATDEEDLESALRVRVPVDHGEFYWSLAEPVLVVRYHAPSNRLFARWFHARNPHLVRRVGEDEDARPSPPPKSIRLDFNESHEWSAETPAALEHAVLAFRRLRAPDLNVPLVFRIGTAQSAPISGIHLAFALRDAASAVGDVIRFEVRAGAGHDLRIDCETDRVLVSLADVASVSFDVASHPDAVTLAADALVAIARALAQVGQVHIAARICAAAAPTSTLIGNPDVAWTLAATMFRARRIEQALALADALDARGDDAGAGASFLFMLAALARGAWLTDEETAQYAQVVERRVERRIERGNRTSAGSEVYNLGVHHRSRREGRRALRMYNRARKLAPDYERRSYFNLELAGILFELGFPRLSAKSYARALEAGQAGMTRALYADALLYAGRYAEAEEQFAIYLREAGEAARSEWVLKHAALPLIRHCGGDTQARCPAEAEGLAHLGYSDTNEAAAALEEALRLDACCGEAWFHLALIRSADADTPAAGAREALIAGLVHRQAPGAWSNAIAMAHAGGATRHLLRRIVEVGYRYNGRELFDAIADGASEVGSRDELLALLDSIAVEADRERSREGFTMRWADEQGELVEIDVVPPNGD